MTSKAPPTQPLNPKMLRQQKIQARGQLSDSEQRLHAQRLCLRIMRSCQFRRAQNIGVYFAQKGEISLAPLIQQAHKLGKTVYVPVILPGFALRFARFTPTTRLVKNRYGILEPRHKQYLSIAELGLLLCPLVAFDSKGRRIGMGGGFYDRALAKTQQKMTAIWGVAHELQRCQHIEAEPWDVPMQKIITEQRIYSAPF